MHPFGKRLKKIRSFRQLTQADIGIMIGLEFKNASATINQYENGIHEPTFDTVKLIAKKLKIPTLYFYAETNKEAERIIRNYVRGMMK